VVGRVAELALDGHDGAVLYLVLAAPELINRANVTLIREVLNQGSSAIIITANQPYKVLKRVYEKEGIDLARVSFIDTVTRSAGVVPIEAERTRFINSPANLTDLGIAIIETLKERRNEKVCVLFDSVSVMLIYASSPNIAKFLHFVTNKLRLSDVLGIFLCVERGVDPVLLSQVTTFVDETVTLDGEGTGQHVRTPAT
jgi:archaellum biogenesis ATPase FlaH